MPKYEPIKQRARFNYSGLSTEQMLELGQGLATSVRQRIEAGLTVDDQAARPLSAGYAKWKARNYPPAIRNWRLLGVTLGSLKVLSASPNKAVVGFTATMRYSPKKNISTPVNLIVSTLNRRQRQFGVSPRDRTALLGAVAKAKRKIITTMTTWEGRQFGVL